MAGESGWQAHARHAQFFMGERISDEKSGIRMDAATGEADMLE